MKFKNKKSTINKHVKNVFLGSLCVTLSVSLGGIYFYLQQTGSSVFAFANNDEEVTVPSVATLPTTGVTEADAQDAAAKESEKTAQVTSQPDASTQPAQTTSPQAAAVTNARSARGVTLYVDPSQSEGRNAIIANNPLSTWIGGWNSNPQGTVNDVVSRAAANGAVATLVLYNIPNRDCGGYSAGGTTAQAYAAWIQSIANGIGGRNAIVILEPDALAQVDCLSTAQQDERYSLISSAVTTLTSKTGASVYIDAGHSAWIGSATMSNRLKKANIQSASGFALNVSNFQTTADNTAYGNKITATTGKGFVIDTSRNGAGPQKGEWCNPSGAKLGQKPTTSVGGNVHAYLWVKTPGESDGECNGGPSAGQYWAQYADSLVL